MATVAVFRIRKWNIIKDRFEISPYYLTRETIGKRRGAVAVEESRIEVDEGEVVNGVYRPKAGDS